LAQRCPKKTGAHAVFCETLCTIVIFLVLQVFFGIQINPFGFLGVQALRVNLVPLFSSHLKYGLCLILFFVNYVLTPGPFSFPPPPPTHKLYCFPRPVLHFSPLAGGLCKVILKKTMFSWGKVRIDLAPSKKNFPRLGLERGIGPKFVGPKFVVFSLLKPPNIKFHIRQKTFYCSGGTGGILCGAKKTLPDWSVLFSLFPILFSVFR